MTHSHPPRQKGPIGLGLCGIGRTGFGRIQSELATLLGPHAKFQVVAGYDLIPDRAQKLSQTIGATSHPTFPALLADPRVEVVVVATRSDTHAELATLALLAGKHVVIEKPIAIDLPQADALLAHARSAPGQLLVRLNRRFDPAFLAVRHAVDRGLTGPLHSVQIRVGDYVPRHDWQTLRKFGGGQLLNWGPHVIDWALELIGPTATDIWAHTRLVAAAGDAEDHVKLLLRGTTGIVADIEVSSASSAPQPLFTLQGQRGAAVTSDARLHIRYLQQPHDRAHLRVDENTPPLDDTRHKVGNLRWLVEDSDLQTAPATPPPGSAYWTAVWDTVRNHRPFPITLDRAREVMRIIDIARSLASRDPTSPSAAPSPPASAPPAHCL